MIYLSLRIYSTKQDVSGGESTFNSFFLHGFLEAVIQGTKLKQFGAELKVGEACLVSMSKQLKELEIQDDERF